MSCSSYTRGSFTRAEQLPLPAGSSSLDRWLLLAFLDWLWDTAVALCLGRSCGRLLPFSRRNAVSVTIRGPSLLTTMPHIVVMSKQEQEEFLVYKCGTGKDKLPSASHMKDSLNSFGFGVNMIEIWVYNWINARNKPRPGWLTAGRMISQVQPVHHPMEVRQPLPSCPHRRSKCQITHALACAPSSSTGIVVDDKGECAEKADQILHQEEDLSHKLRGIHGTDSQNMQVWRHCRQNAIGLPSNPGFGNTLVVVLVTWDAVSKKVFLYMGL